MPFLYKLKVFWPREETRLLIAFFLRFGTPDSGSKFRRYQVFLRYHGASAGMTKGNRLSKRKRSVLRRDDYFYFHHYSFQICITDQAWGQYDWIYDQIPFLHFARLCRPHALKLALLTFKNYVRTYEWSTCSKSSILFSFARNPTSN